MARPEPPAKPGYLARYSVVLLAAVTTVVIACAIDWIYLLWCPEFLVVGKGLNADRLFEETTWLAIRASYWVGLAFGLGLLLANELGPWQQLPMRRLYRYWWWPITAALAAAVISGSVHRANANWILGLESHMLQTPIDVATIWGLNRGAYVGTFFGALIAFARVVRDRQTAGAGPAK